MTVCVVIPVGGFDELLERQLRAVLAQQADTAFSVVLSVNTADPRVVRSVGDLVTRIADVRVYVADSADRRSAAHARNRGVRAAPAEADVIAFCDADDLVEDGWLRGLIDGLGAQAAVGGRVIDVFENPRQAAWRPPATPDGLPTFQGVPYLLSCNMVIRRDAFDSVGGFDTGLVRCEDIAISWALLRAGHVVGYVEDAVVQYRHRPGLWALLRQHELYGRGMSQVLVRYGLPTGDSWETPRGAALLRPNGQRASKRSFVGTLRRGAIAFGRVRGLAGERRAGRATPSAPAVGVHR